MTHNEIKQLKTADLIMLTFEKDIMIAPIARFELKERGIDIEQAESALIFDLSIITNIKSMLHTNLHELHELIKGLCKWLILK